MGIHLETYRNIIYLPFLKHSYLNIFFGSFPGQTAYFQFKKAIYLKDKIV